jgi:hypothetical protein
MAEVNKDLLIPWALDAGTDNIPEYTGRDLRDLFAVFFEPKSDSEPFRAAPGILRGCSVSASSTEVTVQPGHCVVTTAGGSFLTGVKNPVTLPLSAPNATFTRIDLVALSIEETADSGRGAKIQVIEGTPRSYPTEPSIPDGAVVLAAIRVLTAGAPRVTPGAEASLAGASKKEELPITEYMRGSGTRYAQVKGFTLPGGAVLVTVDATMSGSGDTIATGLYGLSAWYGTLGSAEHLWWCELNRGNLRVMGDTPPSSSRLMGSFIVKRQD